MSLRLLLALLFLLPTIARADFKTQGLQTLNTIDHHFSLPSGLYSVHPNTPSSKSPPATLWEAGVQLSALNAAAQLDPSRIPQAARFADALAAYRTTTNGLQAYKPLPNSPPTDIYYDDNQWLILAFLETHDLTHDDRYLRLARETFAFIASGESLDLGGGVWWRLRRDSKNTCSNAPAICAALRLYQTSPDPTYLQFAQRLYRWTNAHFQDTDGLFFDTLRLDGSIEKTKWSYNTALMIRANLLFHAITHDPKYLTEAQRLARAAEAHWFRASDGALTDIAPFAHLLCESLLFLGDADHDPSHAAKVRRALDFLSTTSRNDLYPRRWDGRTDKETTGKQKPSLIDQSSAARAFLFAAQHTSP